MSADELFDGNELDGIDVELVSLEVVDLNNPKLKTNNIAHTNTNEMYRANVTLLPAVWSSIVEPLNRVGFAPANQDRDNGAI